MPPFPKPVSQAQRGAMYSAASGHSTLDIPKKVGQEFVKGDKPGKLPAYKGKSEERGEKKKDNERREPVHFSPLSHLGRRRQ